MITLLLPGWAAGAVFGALAIGALVPASIMSVAAAMLFTRNVYVEYVNPNTTPKQQTSIARFVRTIAGSPTQTTASVRNTSTRCSVASAGSSATRDRRRPAQPGGQPSKRGSASPLGRLAGIVRAGEWWEYKLVPILSLFYATDFADQPVVIFCVPGNANASFHAVHGVVPVLVSTNEPVP